MNWKFVRRNRSMGLPVIWNLRVILERVTDIFLTASLTCFTCFASHLFAHSLAQTWNQQPPLQIANSKTVLTHQIHQQPFTLPVSQNKLQWVVYAFVNGSWSCLQSSFRAASEKPLWWWLSFPARLVKSRNPRCVVPNQLIMSRNTGEIVCLLLFWNWKEMCLDLFLSLSSVLSLWCRPKHQVIWEAAQTQWPKHKQLKHSDWKTVTKIQQPKHGSTATKHK